MKRDIKIRKGEKKDLKKIMMLYDLARGFMRETGNLSQWDDGYPSQKDVEEDLDNGVCHVGENEQGSVVMVFAFLQGEDKTYAKIYEGDWLNDEPYGTIHRLASDGKTGGVLRACADYCFRLVENIRVDTHRDNLPMLRGLTKLGFKRCGKIICRDGTERVAFQKKK